MDAEKQKELGVNFNNDEAREQFDRFVASQKPATEKKRDEMVSNWEKEIEKLNSEIDEEKKKFSTISPILEKYNCPNERSILTTTNELDKKKYSLEADMEKCRRTIISKQGERHLAERKYNEVDTSFLTFGRNNDVKKTHGNDIEKISNEISAEEAKNADFKKKWSEIDAEKTRFISSLQNWVGAPAESNLSAHDVARLIWDKFDLMDKKIQALNQKKAELNKEIAEITTKESR